MIHALTIHAITYSPSKNELFTLKNELFTLKNELFTRNNVFKLTWMRQNHFWSRFDRVDLIESIRSIRSSRFDWKWLPGRILSCLDLNWVQIGPKMAIFGPIFAYLQFVNSEFNKYLIVVFVNSDFSKF